MSGAASIAAAKNRRTKPDPNQKPIISCSTKPGPAPPGTKTQQNALKSSPASASVFDEESLQITGPMPLLQVLKVHEQRLNKLDEKIAQKQVLEPTIFSATVPAQQCSVETQGCDEECYERLQTLEEKIQMLEEVIMNLQLTLTNVQSFAMETSLAMLKLQNTQTSRPVTPPAAAIASPIAEITLAVEELTTPI